MVSYAWREDMMYHKSLFSVMLEEAKDTEMQGGNTTFDDNTVIWLSAFALFQAGDTEN